MSSLKWSLASGKTTFAPSSASSATGAPFAGGAPFPFGGGALAPFPPPLAATASS